MYSAPPGALNTIVYENPLNLLLKLLVKEGEHLLLGDFNLHHPLWNTRHTLTKY